jgi:hypothetical protein
MSVPGSGRSGGGHQFPFYPSWPTEKIQILIEADCVLAKTRAACNRVNERTRGETETAPGSAAAARVLELTGCVVRVRILGGVRPLALRGLGLCRGVAPLEAEADGGGPGPEYG